MCIRFIQSLTPSQLKHLEDTGELRRAFLRKSQGHECCRGVMILAAHACGLINPNRIGNQKSAIDLICAWVVCNQMCDSFQEHTNQLSRGDQPTTLFGFVCIFDFRWIIWKLKSFIKRGKVEYLFSNSLEILPPLEWLNGNNIQNYIFWKWSAETDSFLRWFWKYIFQPFLLFTAIVLMIYSSQMFYHSAYCLDSGFEWIVGSFCMKTVTLPKKKCDKYKHLVQNILCVMCYISNSIMMNITKYQNIFNSFLQWHHNLFILNPQMWHFESRYQLNNFKIFNEIFQILKWKTDFTFL